MGVWTELFENTTMIAPRPDRLTVRSQVLNMRRFLLAESYHSETNVSSVAQIFVSVVAHFFVIVGGSRIHEHTAHFFIDIFILR